MVKFLSNLVDPKLMEEVCLYENSTERDQMENLSELYAVINSLECLEKLFSKDFIPGKDYSRECKKLLGQFKVVLNTVRGTDVNEFVRKYRINCPAALERIKEDRPITVRDDLGTHSTTADVVSLFITIIDHIELGFHAMADLQPDLKELHESLNLFGLLKEEHEVKGKVKFWLRTLNAMAATQNVDETQVKQMSFDLNQALDNFKRFLKTLT
ncbi:hypothetical protein L596_008385 [Steinernema carpocapsae]|uniref:Vacuolar protein sorting-associated protein 28 homolog n=1 Tax=Steinernema carpocapsae TaxID=34508 RepID=A0A4U5PCK9_STECR|nr:hypothetical protein L596_008385 [Steinernema carpocapsae]